MVFLFFFLDYHCTLLLGNLVTACLGFYLHIGTIIREWPEAIQATYSNTIQKLELSFTKQRAVRRENQRAKVDEPNRDGVEENTEQGQQMIINKNLRPIEEVSVTPLGKVELSFVALEILVDNFYIPAYVYRAIDEWI